MREGVSRLGGKGVAFFVGGREFMHFHGGACIDVRVTRANVARLREDPRVVLRSTASDWVEFTVGRPGDVKGALAVVKLAWTAATKGGGGKAP